MGDQQQDRPFQGIINVEAKVADADNQIHLQTIGSPPYSLFPDDGSAADGYPFPSTSGVCASFVLASSYMHEDFWL